MTKDKWYTLYNLTVNKFMGQMISDDVDNWKFNKSCLLKMIEQIDESTEVYNMENKK